MYIIRFLSSFQHPRFEQDGSKGFPNDIALVFLKKDAPINGKTVGTACLPKSATADYKDKECWISGWGQLGGECAILT